MEQNEHSAQMNFPFDNLLYNVNNRIDEAYPTTTTTSVATASRDKQHYSTVRRNAQAYNNSINRNIHPGYSLARDLHIYNNYINVQAYTNTSIDRTTASQTYGIDRNQHFLDPNRNDAINSDIAETSSGCSRKTMQVYMQPESHTLHNTSHEMETRYVYYDNDNNPKNSLQTRFDNKNERSMPTLVSLLGQQPDVLRHKHFSVNHPSTSTSQESNVRNAELQSSSAGKNVGQVVGEEICVEEISCSELEEDVQPTDSGIYSNTEGDSNAGQNGVGNQETKPSEDQCKESTPHVSSTPPQQPPEQPRANNTINTNDSTPHSQDTLLTLQQAQKELNDICFHLDRTCSHNNNDREGLSSQSGLETSAHDLKSKLRLALEKVETVTHQMYTLGVAERVANERIKKLEEANIKFQIENCQLKYTVSSLETQLNSRDKPTRTLRSRGVTLNQLLSGPAPAQSKPPPQKRKASIPRRKILKEDFFIPQQTSSPKPQHNQQSPTVLARRKTQKENLFTSPQRSSPKRNYIQRSPIVAARRNKDKHKPLHLRPKPFKCLVCGKCFLTERFLNTHSNVHVNEKQYQCGLCLRQFKRETHWKRHKCGRRFTCDLCGKGFLYNCDIERHIATHLSLKPYECKTCGSSFRFSKDLAKHEFIHTGLKKYVCDVCGKGFIHKNSFRQHKDRHFGVKPFQCDTCGMAFSGQSDLIRHKRVHSTDRIFKCDICGKTYRQLQSLRMHKMVHTGEKPFQCEVCGRGFKTIRNLNAHMVRGKHRVFPTEKKCDICGKEFAKAQLLTDHKASHSDDRPYPCDLCDKAFKFRRNLNVHRLTHLRKKNGKNGNQAPVLETLGKEKGTVNNGKALNEIAVIDTTCNEKNSLHLLDNQNKQAEIPELCNPNRGKEVKLSNQMKPNELPLFNTLKRENQMHISDTRKIEYQMHMFGTPKRESQIQMLNTPKRENIMPVFNTPKRGNQVHMFHIPNYTQL